MKPRRYIWILLLSVACLGVTLWVLSSTEQPSLSGVSHPEPAVEDLSVVDSLSHALEALGDTLRLRQ